MGIKFRLPIEHLQCFVGRKSRPNDPASPNRAGGECFYRSTALAVDCPAWDLCIGTMPGVDEEAFRADPRKSPTPYIHCWVEFNDIVIDPARIERDGNELCEYSKISYYDITGAQDVYRIKGRRVEELAHINGWSRRFLADEPFESDQLVRTLLTEAAVPYEESSRRGIVPRGTIMPDYAL